MLVVGSNGSMAVVAQTRDGDQLLGPRGLYCRVWEVFDVIFDKILRRVLR